MQPGIFPCAFLPSISYVQIWMSASKPIIDLGEPYIRQTFRNRAHILGSQGVTKLIIPVKKGPSNQPMHEVMIDYHHAWPRKYWHAITSAYQNAPYFEHYAVELQDIWLSQPDSLARFSLDLFRWIMQQIQPETKIKANNLSNIGTVDDYRKMDFLDIGNNDYLPYKQVFSYKFPFYQNLSVLDLLFNRGPETVYIISKKKCF